MPFGGVYAARTLLCVSLDYIAQLKETQRENELDPVACAAMCEKSGCNGVAVHLRGDRPCLKNRDILAIRQVVRGKMNIGIALTDELIHFAQEAKPDLVTLIPEKEEEMTIEGGLDVPKVFTRIQNAAALFHDRGIPVCLLVDPDTAKMDLSKECGVDFVQINTGKYSHAADKGEIDRELKRIYNAADHAAKLRLKITAGHGLDYTNIEPVLNARGLLEVNIGRSIMARSVVVGLRLAIDEMLEILE